MELEEKDNNIQDSENTSEEAIEDTEVAEENSLSLEEVQAMKDKLSSCEDRLLRVTAEYDNFRKRTEKEKLQIYSHATSKVILGMLPVADSLDLAEKSIEGSGEEYKKGLSMVKAQLTEALKKLGVEVFGEIGDEFNPDIHNAVSHIDDEKNEKENVISEVFQKGYKLQDKVIRHAMVQVTN